MSKWEKKFGKYAIPNLTIVLIGCYVAGYILQTFAPNVLGLLTLNPYAVLHGQIWRLFTWIISPPSSSNIFFTLIMLLFYFSLGTSLERVWGTWQYNVYIFTGIFLTVLGSFLCMGIVYLITGSMDPKVASTLFAGGAAYISTYYINMSIFLAYAATFPEAQILLMFIIPVKVKWMGWIYGAIMVVDVLQITRQSIVLLSQGNLFGAVYLFMGIAIVASLINFAILKIRNGKHVHLGPKQIKRRAEFKQDIRRNPKITRHKCAVCGQTEEDNPSLEFRFCSKCNGNYEYCQHHLFTHEHVK